MAMLRLFIEQPLRLGLSNRITQIHSRALSLWRSTVSRIPWKLRPLEWALLTIGVAALLAFVYVLWRQPVSRR
jgi:hypothetical protein